MAMSDQWTRFQRNLGVWQGSFVTFNQQLVLQQVQPSELTLALAPSRSSIELLLLFWPDQQDLPAMPPSGEPVKRICQSFSDLPSELCFFPTGSFCRGSLFIAPVRQAWTRTYAEFGFLCGDRRHRLVLLWDGAGRMDRIVLIREFRSRSGALERPAFELAMLDGDWLLQETRRVSGKTADHSTARQDRFRLGTESSSGLIALPDGGAIRAPLQLGESAELVIEAWWSAGPDRIERITRRYDQHGSWMAADHQLLTRA